MSIKVMCKVWDESRHEGAALLALLALADWCNDEGICWPNQAKLAQRIRLADRQTRNILRLLQDSGELYVSAGRGRKTSRYFVLVGVEPPQVSRTLRDFFGLPSAEAESHAAKLSERQRSATQSGNGVPLRAVTECHSEWQSSVKSKAEKADAVGLPAIRSVNDPSKEPSESSAPAGAGTRKTTRKPQPRDLVSDAIAQGGYAMKRGSRFTSIAAAEVIRDQLGERPSPEQLAALAADLTAMYAWWPGGHAGLSAPVKAPAVIKALTEWRAARPVVVAPPTPKADTACLSCGGAGFVMMLQYRDGRREPKRGLTPPEADEIAVPCGCRRSA